VLRSRGGSPRVAREADVHTESLLLELGDLAGPDARAPTGPVARLLDYDRAHGGMLTPTLQAWLDTFGDVIAAAAALRVHPNTFRYRMRRVTEVSGFDPDDADARFAAMLQLRLLGATAIRPEAPD
jgi:DNA-binding PucR family transcriptional regulator